MNELSTKSDPYDDAWLTIITPAGDQNASNFKTVWKYRELIKALAFRSIKTRFRGAKLGLVWAIVQPLAYMLVLNLFFSLIARFDTHGVPYPIHLLTGLVVFQFFSKGMSEGSNSINGNKGILSKIYIPPIVFPASAILTGLIDFILPVILLVVFLAFYQVSPNINIIYLPVFLLMLFILFTSAHLFMSATALVNHDIKMMVPVVSQLLFFGTPIFYPFSSIPKDYVVFFALNPMVGVVEGVRWSVLGLENPPDANILLTSGIMTFVLLFVAIFTFRRLASSFYKYL